MGGTVHYKPFVLNLTATTNPGVSNDNTEGYTVGSSWFNVASGRIFDAVDVSTGAAVWVEGAGIRDIIKDADGDTSIEVERTGDDDTIRLKVNGSDAVKIPPTGFFTLIGNNTGDANVTVMLFEDNAGTFLGGIGDDLAGDNHLAFFSNERQIDLDTGAGGTETVSVRNHMVVGADSISAASLVMEVIGGANGAFRTGNSSTAQRNGFTALNGMIVYDTDLNLTFFREGAVWKAKADFGLLEDVDGDTKIQVEESADEDIIRMDVATVEKVIIDSEGFKPENVFKSVNAGVTASTTQTQGQAPQTKDVIQVSTVAFANDVITLPTASAGRNIFIKNDGANTLQIFPASGDDIDGTGVDSSVTLAVGVSVRYFAYDATNWTS